MKKIQVEKRVIEIIDPLIRGLGYELVEVEYIKEGSNWYLRVYIDKDDGISIGDCEIVSQKIDNIVEDAEITEHSYFLEVSSPGLERVLKKDKEFEKYKGDNVRVKLYKAIEGEKTFEGTLQGLFGTVIHIKTEKGILIKFKKEDVAIVRRTIKFK